MKTILMAIFCEHTFEEEKNILDQVDEWKLLIMDSL